MLLLTFAFALLVAFALCAYRLAYGPQKQLAAVGLVAGVSAVCFCGIAYPKEQSAWLWAGYASGAVMLLVLGLLVTTSVVHWVKTPLEPNTD